MRPVGGTLCRLESAACNPQSVFFLPCLFASRFAARFALAMRSRCSLAPLSPPPNRVEADLPPGSRHYQVESVSGRVGAGGGMETNPQTPMIYWSALDWPQPRGIYIYIIEEEEHCGEGGGCFNTFV
jgi:hypothetical protein